MNNLFLIGFMGAGKSSVSPDWAGCWAGRALKWTRASPP